MIQQARCVPANHRPAGQSHGSGGFRRNHRSHRAFPAAVAELCCYAGSPAERANIPYNPLTNFLHAYDDTLLTANETTDVNNPIVAPLATLAASARRQENQRIHWNLSL